MPRELAQLLLDEGVVGPDGVEQALARQREAGGALDTALLELGLVGEEQLVGLLSRASDLPAAPLSVYEAVDARARRVFPSKVAERHGLAPFALDGRELSLVATCPLDLGLLDEISFMLSLHLSPHVGPEWRVRSLIQRLYGGPLAPRLARLAEASGGPVEVRSAPPAAPLDAAPVPASTPEPAPAAPTPRPHPQRPVGFTGFRSADDEPLEPLAAALAQAAEAFELDWEAEALATPLPEVGRVAAGGDAPQAAAAAPEPPGAAGEPPLEPEPQELDRSAPPRWTVAAARAVLDAATTRDGIVLAALRYARDFFQYAGLFAVTRDAVAGHDALGVEDGAREVVRTVALYVSDPGIFRTSLDTLAPYLGPVSRDASGSAAVLDGLGRGSPRTALVYPILLRGRPICILYADNGQAPVSARRLGDLLLVLSLVGGAFERIIKARKGGRPYPPSAWTQPRLTATTPAPGVEPEAAPPSVDAAPPADQAAPAPPPGEHPAARLAVPAPEEQPPAAEPDLAERAAPPAEPVAPAEAAKAASPSWAEGPEAQDVPSAEIARAEAGAAPPPGAPPVEPLPEDAPPLTLEAGRAPAVPALEPGLPPEVSAAFPEPPPLPPEPSPAPAAAPAAPTDLSDVEEAFFSSAPGQAAAVAAPPAAPPTPLVVPAPPPQEVSISLELTLERPLQPAAPPAPLAVDEAPAEVSISLELTGERPLGPVAPDLAPGPASAPAPGPEVPREAAAAFPGLPSLPGVEAAPPPAAPPPDVAPPAPPDPEITLERPLATTRPVAPVDPAALVGTYLVSPRGSDERAFLLGKLVERAAEVAPILCDQLPGPLDVPSEALATTPAPDQGPVLAAVAALGPAAGKALLGMLGDPSPPRRRAAVALLGQLGDPAAFPPVAERCFDHDPAVAQAARTALALHRRDPGMKPVPDKLRRALLSGLADKAASAARAIAALRDAESIPLLIQALEGSDAGTAGAAADALAAITLQRHGVKARDWLMWWKVNRGRQRTEWLFGALTSGDRDLRLLAATELREAAASPVSYSADLPEAERVAAAQAWQRWFQKSGHRL